MSKEIDIDLYRKNNNVKRSYTVLMINLSSIEKFHNEVIGTYSKAQNMIDKIVGDVKDNIIDPVYWPTPTSYILAIAKDNNLCLHCEIRFTQKKDNTLEEKYCKVYRIYTENKEELDKISSGIEDNLKKLKIAVVKRG